MTTTPQSPAAWADEALDLAADPFRAFAAWYAAAEQHAPQPEAMTLATVDAHGQPAARMVLFRGMTGTPPAPRGLRFFTNYGSRKGAELEGNDRAALLFYWQPLRRQVRIEGRVQRLPAAEADSYFATRDRDSQLGAWASRQSTPLASREDLESRLEAMRTRFGADPVPRPPFWGGYLLVPTCFEFWQNRPNRLHDRFRYEPHGDRWQITRLAP